MERVRGDIELGADWKAFGRVKEEIEFEGKLGGDLVSYGGQSS